jgi:hypothetical protein
MLTNQVNHIVCEMLVPKMEDKVDLYLLNELDPTLHHFIDSAQPSALPVIEENIPYLSWKSYLPADVNLAPAIDLLIDLLSKGSGIIHLQPQEFIINHQNLSLELLNLEIIGLDSIQEVLFSYPDHDLTNTSFNLLITLPTLELSSVWLINYPYRSQTMIDSTGKPSYQEKILVKMSLEELILTMTMTMAIKVEELSSLYVDQLVAQDKHNCMMSMTDYLGVSSLSSNTLHVSSVKLDQLIGDAGSLESDLVAMIDNLFQLSLEEFDALLSQTINAIIQEPARQAINLSLNQTISEAVCPAHIPSPDQYLIWSNVTIIHTINELVSLFGASGINQLIDLLTNDTASFSMMIMDERIKVDITGLDSIYDINLMQTKSSLPYNLDNLLGIGTADTPMTVSLSSGGRTISWAMIGLSAKLELNMMMNQGRIMNYQVNQLVLESGCMLASFDSLAISNLQLNISNAVMMLSPSPDSQENKSVDVTALLQLIFNYLSYSTNQAHINAYLNQSLVTANATCYGEVIPPSDDDLSDDSTTMPIYAIVIIILVAVAIIVILATLYGRYQLQRYAEDHPSKTVSPADQVEGKEVDIAWYQAYEDWLVSYYPYHEALIGNPSISLMLRLILPVLVLFNMLIFAYSYSKNDVATVELVINVLDKSIKPPPLFEFGLTNSIEDMWEAKVYSLALLIAIFSCIWPQVKLIMMLFAWMLPESRLSITQRERMLLILDKYGKWSVVDFYVMILM